MADDVEGFCQAIRTGLATATFSQRRQLAELLIDRVVVTDGEVEMRYVLPTSPDGSHPFCQLRRDHLDAPPGRVPLDDPCCRRGGIGGDQGQVMDGRGPVVDEHDGDGPGCRRPRAAGRLAAALMTAVLP